MQHNFDVEIAKDYGILEAILLQNIWFWIEKNKANNTHFYDGKYWTYNSRKAFAKIFPYMSEKQIRTALEKLIDNGILEKGNYNKAGFDKTLWYSITPMGYAVLLKCPIDLPHRADGVDQEGKPIPDINTYINNIYSPSGDEQDNENELATNFDKIWKHYPRKDGKNTAYKHYKAWLKGRSFAGVKEKLTNKEMYYAVKIYAYECDRDKKDKQYIQMGSTFFNETIFEKVKRYNKYPVEWEQKINEWENLKNESL